MSQTSETANDQPKVKKAICSTCGGSRNCDILAFFEEKGTEPETDIDWAKDWFLLRCCGCEHVFVQTVSSNSEDMQLYHDESGNVEEQPIESVNYWPALAKRQRPDWFSSSEIELQDALPLWHSLYELYVALDNDLNTLAGIGIRTSFDVASELLGIDTELSFKKKLDALVTQGHIGKPDCARLETLVEAGSASAHRGWQPTANDLNAMMDVLEHFILDTFIVPRRKARIDKKINKTKQNVPVRKKKAKAAAPAGGTTT